MKTTLDFLLNLPNKLFQANRDAGIREAECEKSAMDIKYSTDTKIEDNSRGFKMQKANFDTEVNTAVSWNITNILVTYFLLSTESRSSDGL